MKVGKLNPPWVIDLPAEGRGEGVEVEGDGEGTRGLLELTPDQGREAKDMLWVARK